MDEQGMSGFKVGTLALLVQLHVVIELLVKANLQHSCKLLVL